MIAMRLFARMKKNSEARYGANGSPCGPIDVAGDAVADERVAALAEELQLARDDLRLAHGRDQEARSSPASRSRGSA